MEDSKTRMLRYLNDSYASEVGGLMSLRDLLNVVGSDPEMKAAIRQHARVTESQIERLTTRILALGGDKSEPKAVVNSVIARGSTLLNIFHRHDDKLTQDLIKAYAFERFEIGAYIALQAYAEAIGDEETTMLAMQFIDEEQTASDALEKFIPISALQAATSSPGTQASDKAPFDVSPAALLIPGAILAAWGVSKWLLGRGENRFATASGSSEPQYAISDVAVLEPTSSGEATPYHSENAYAPIAFADETGQTLAPEK